MKIFLYFILGAIGSKFIKDNLPNLHYKNLIATFNKQLMPVLLLGALGYYSILSKISKDKEVQKTYMILLIVIIATITLQKIIQQNKKPAAQHQHPHKK